jgi:hypothetical protein
MKGRNASEQAWSDGPRIAEDGTDRTPKRWVDCEPERDRCQWAEVLAVRVEGRAKPPRAGEARGQVVVLVDWQLSLLFSCDIRMKVSPLISSLLLGAALSHSSVVTLLSLQSHC